LNGDYIQKIGCTFGIALARCTQCQLILLDCRDNLVEIAVREALANTIIHGNHENPRKYVYVRCCFKRDEVSIALKDEGGGFDINTVADPTARENTGSVHGRGIYLMKAFMDDVRFEEGGVVIRMRKSASQAAARDA
jgi:anti-sigma regulatory factor (Ser/Thr protein kinase)